MASGLENADDKFMIVWALMCLSASLLAQPSLRITSPADGTVFHPGESIKVNVEASGTFKMVMVIGYDPLGGTFPLSAPPYEFTIQIPDRYHIAPGRYLLTADGFIEPGKSVASKTVVIKVEPADVHLKLKVNSLDRAIIFPRLASSRTA
jgi:Big-like domain-containing protein